MKKLFKVLGILIVLIIVSGAIFYFTTNEALPKGKKGKAAEELAQKMLKAIQHDAFLNTEVLEWSFRDSHFYIWKKRENIVEVTWDQNKVILHTQQPSQSEVYVNDQKTDDPKLIQTAINYFNNDSFWLIAPHKILDPGTERSIVQHNGKDALLVTYTSGGSTPGDSYLWILNDEGFPISYKMWTSIIPIGGVAATWDQWTTTETGIQLPTKHQLSLFGMSLDMGSVKAYNPKADELARKILKAVRHEAYKKTKHIEWSFGGRRHFKWNKADHIVEVVWDTTKVILHPNNLEKSTVYYNDKLTNTPNQKTIKRANDLFNNDSFWLVAPHKLFEPGIIRSIQQIDGKDGLLVKYTTGGTTPGDSYLWSLDDNFVPKSYKMYVPSMKMVAVPATWEDWIVTESGTLLPKNHVFSNGRNLSMGEVKGY